MNNLLDQLNEASEATEVTFCRIKLIECNVEGLKKDLLTKIVRYSKNSLNMGVLISLGYIVKAN